LSKQPPPEEKLPLAVSRMLRPLIRLCIRHEITHAQLAEQVRLLYVSSAYKYFPIPDAEMTYARVSVLTGLSRKEIRRLSEILEKANESNRKFPISEAIPNRAQRVVHGWMNDEEFIDSGGKPRLLPLKNNENGKEASSFVALVNRYAGDVTWGAVLEELNHIAVTEMSDKNTVRLINESYIPHKKDIDQIWIIAKLISDFMGTLFYNVESDDIGEKKLQRQVIYSPIDESLVDEIRDMIKEDTEALLRKVNLRLKKAKVNTDTSVENTKYMRVGLGVYYVEDEVEVELKSDDE